MKKNKISLLAAFIAFLIAIVGFLGVIFQNKSIFVLYGDSVQQQYAFILGFWQKVHDLDFSLFEWSNGFGANTFSYIFYNLFSPFNLLYLPFPKELIQHLMLYVNIFKMMVLAYFSCKWLQKCFDKPEVSIAGSIMITFSGWVLFYFHYQFLDAFVFYPLILYFSEEFLQKKRKRGLVLSIAVLTFVNYYFMYMFVPFLWLYALFRYLILHSNAKVKDVIHDGLVFLVLSLLGMGIAGVILLPCLNFILNSPRLSTERLSLFVGVKDCFKIFTSLLSPVLSRIEPSNYIYQSQLTYQGWGGGASLYVSIFALVLLPYVLLLKDKRKRNILLVFAGIISVFLICPHFYKLFQGSVDTRFFYMFSLLEVMLCCEALSDSDVFKGKLNILFTLFAVIICIFCFQTSWKLWLSSDIALQSQLRIQIILFALLFVGQFILLKKGVKYWCGILVLEAIFSMYLFVSHNMPIKSADFCYVTSVDKTVESIKQQDEGFYRVLFDDKDCGLSNDAYIHQVAGVSFYSSIYAYEQEDFLMRLKSGWSLPNINGRYRLYTLTGAKYWVSDKNETNVPVGYEKVEEENYYLNQNFVELGYAVDQTLSLEKFLSLPILEQDRVLQEYLVLDESDNTEYVLHDDLVTIIEWAIPEYIEVNLKEPLSDSIIYIENFGMPLIDVSLYYKGELVRKESYDQYNYVDLYLNRDEIVDKIVVVCQDIEDTGSSVNIYASKNASITERKQFEKRNSKSFKNILFDGDKIFAEITLDSMSYVLTQIPYDSGWKAFVNGEEIPVINGNGGFVTIQLDEGNHQVVFEYQMPWMNYGFVLSAVSIFVLGAWWAKEHHQKMK